MRQESSISELLELLVTSMYYFDPKQEVRKRPLGLAGEILLVLLTDDHGGHSQGLRLLAGGQD